MDDPSRGLEERRARLERLARRRAFESYLRYGRVPEAKALGDARPTTHYIWRTARDERVRTAHAANEGRVFAWTDPPETGHPGEAHQCRCWAQPYYGNPTVPDAIRSLQRDLRTDATGQEPWTSIETLTRLDGSLAETLVQGRDGTRFHSTFAGSRVTHEVTLPDGQKVWVETRDGVQTIYAGEARTPVLQTIWTARGPQVSLPRTRVADAGVLSVPTLAFLTAATLAALYALYNMLQAQPESFGAGAADVPIMAFEAWDHSGNRDAAPVMTGTLTQEQVRQFCRRLPEVQAWTDEAARLNAPQRWLLGPQRYGVAVHQWVKLKIEALQYTGTHDDLRAEYSIDPASRIEAVYGKIGTSRLDVIEDRQAEIDMVCVYDIKTGQAGLTPTRLQQIGKVVNKHVGAARFIVIEVRPFE